jgi:2-polyprenyl-3-methyl-5-hydroxy-6-metoxy-1,4-benzoquinol methylase
MQRVCEPELMDAAAQAAAYAAADFSVGDRAVVERVVALLAEAPAQPPPSLIDLGCGPGNISFVLAEHLPAARVLGVDGAEAMLQIARLRLAGAPQRWPGLGFARALLTPAGLQPAPAGRFSAVVSNSLLHHLHGPQVLWTAVRQLAAPGALVFVRDLRRPASPAAVLALRDRYLSDAPPVLQHDYVASLHAAFTAVEVQQQLLAAGLADQLQVAERDDRYLEVWGRLAG